MLALIVKYKLALFQQYRKQNGKMVWKQMGIIARKIPWGFEDEKGKALAKDLGILYLKDIHTWKKVVEDL